MINVDLRRYGTDKVYAQFINGYISGTDIDEIPIVRELTAVEEVKAFGIHRMEEENGIHEN